MAAERDGVDGSELDPPAAIETSERRGETRAPTRPTSRTGRPGRRPRLAAALAVAATVALAAPACTDDDASAATTTTLQPPPLTTAPPTTDHPEPTEEEEVEAAYLAIMERYYERHLDPDPDDPSISNDHEGEHRTVLVARLRELNEEGQSARFTADGPPVPTVTAVEIDGETARVMNCLVDDALVVDSATGEVVIDSVGSYQLETVLSRTGDHWRISEQLVDEHWFDGRGCSR
jgi:hypothetical protein